MTRSGTVLVIEYEDIERERISAALEADGFDVIECPGPHEPDFTCLGSRGLDCPLVRDADTVVLDLHLETDEMMIGTPGWVLLTYYMERGKRVVALSGAEDSVHPLPEENVVVLRRPASTESILWAVRQFALEVEADSLSRT